MAERNIDEAIAKLDSIVGELSTLEKLEADLAQKENEILKRIQVLNGYEERLSSCLEKMEEVSDKVDSFAKESEPLVKRLDSLLKRFGGELEEAKQLETKLMMRKMDELLSKAEALAPKEEMEEETKPLPKKTSSGKFNPDSSKRLKPGAGKKQ